VREQVTPEFESPVGAGVNLCKGRHVIGFVRAQPWITACDPSAKPSTESGSTPREHLHHTRLAAATRALFVPIERVREAAQCFSCYYTRADTRPSRGDMDVVCVILRTGTPSRAAIKIERRD
jgi:hypothetical protein